MPANPMVFTRRPLRNWLRERLIDRAVAAGAPRPLAEAVVDDVASERPLLDWLMNGGFEALFKMIMELISMFGAMYEGSGEGVVVTRQQPPQPASSATSFPAPKVNPQTGK